MPNELGVAVPVAQVNDDCAIQHASGGVRLAYHLWQGRRSVNSFLALQPPTDEARTTCWEKHMKMTIRRYLQIRTRLRVGAWSRLA
jgi:hypothetical protein